MQTSVKILSLRDTDVLWNRQNTDIVCVSPLESINFNKSAKIHWVHNIFLPMRQRDAIFSGAGKFCLAHGLRQLSRGVKSDVRILNDRNDVNSLPRKTSNDVRIRSLGDVKCQN